MTMVLVYRGKYPGLPQYGRSGLQRSHGVWMKGASASQPISFSNIYFVLVKILPVKDLQ